MGHTQRHTYNKHRRGFSFFGGGVISYVEVERRGFVWQRGFIHNNSARLVLSRSEVKDWTLYAYFKAL